MHSNNIYEFNFIYETTNNINGKVYRGVHLTNNLDDEYLGSGTLLKKAIKKYGKENFSREILFFAFSRELADLAEAEFVSESWLLENKGNIYNICVGGTRASSYHLVGDKIQHRSKNKVVVIDSEGNTFQVEIDDPRYISGELVGVTKGKAVYLLDGKPILVDKDDLRIKTGELVHIFKNKIPVKFANTEKIFQVDVSDERLQTGELVHMSRNMVSSINKNGIRKMIPLSEFNDKNNNDWVGVTKNKCNMVDKDGNKYHVDISDPRILSGELFSACTNKSTFKDSEGNKYYLDISDPIIKLKNLINNNCGIGITVYNNSNETINISMEEYNNNKSLYRRINAGRIRVYSESGVEKLMYPHDDLVVSEKMKTRKEWVKLGNINIPKRNFKL